MLDSMRARSVLAAGMAGLLWHAAPATKGQTEDRRFTLQARVEPERVVPGGWIDVIAALAFDPGWHATSPLSPNGPRVKFVCTVPEGFEPVGEILVEESAPATDPQLGAVELLHGRVELRRRFAVPRGASGPFSARIELGLTVCDAFRCLPRTSVEANSSFTVDAQSGAIAPAPAQTTAIAPPDDAERALLERRGYLVRARQEGSCAPGQGAFVLLEFLLEPGSTLKLVPDEDPLGRTRAERAKGFERLPLCLPVETRNGEAAVDRSFRAYQVFRTSPDLAPGSYEIPYFTGVRGRDGAALEQPLTLMLVLSDPRPAAAK